MCRAINKASDTVYILFMILCHLLKWTGGIGNLFSWEHANNLSTRRLQFTSTLDIEKQIQNTFQGIYMLFKYLYLFIRTNWPKYTWIHKYTKTQITSILEENHPFWIQVLFCAVLRIILQPHFHKLNGIIL